jgi:hypothetical protein
VYCGQNGIQCWATDELQVPSIELLLGGVTQVPHCNLRSMVRKTELFTLQMGYVLCRQLPPRNYSSGPWSHTQKDCLGHLMNE